MRYFLSCINIQFHFNSMYYCIFMKQTYKLQRIIRANNISIFITWSLEFSRNAHSVTGYLSICFALAKLGPEFERIFNFCLVRIVEQRHLCGTFLWETWFGYGSIAERGPQTVKKGTFNCWSCSRTLEKKRLCQTNATFHNNYECTAYLSWWAGLSNCFTVFWSPEFFSGFFTQL